MPRATDETPLLELRGITAAYERVAVLRGIDLRVPAGSLVAILGPNGAGKSTLLRVITGLLRPTSGSVLLDGYDVTGASAVQLAQAGVCLIPEGRAIFPNLTVRENIVMDTYGSGKSDRELEEVAYHWFPQIAGRREQVAGTLSGGEQQMLSLSRAFSTDPALILLDELSMGLAPMIVDELFRVVHELTATGVTTVVVEQFAEVVLELADEVALMSRGKIQFVGNPRRARQELHSAYLGAMR